MANTHDLVFVLFYHSDTEAQVRFFAPSNTWPGWVLTMGDDFEQFKKVFDLLLEADKKIWEAVVEIRDGEIKKLEGFVQPLMKLRGDMHVEFMRPIYKKYPKIAKMTGLDAKDD